MMYGSTTKEEILPNRRAARTDDDGYLEVKSVGGTLPTDAATETTLAAVLAKIIASPATSAKQDALIALLPTALKHSRLDVLNTENSLIATAGGQSQAVAISGTSAQSAAITAGFANVTPTVDCFVRAGTTPTALADGTDQILLGGNTYRITAITSGEKLAFITTGATGTVYITPGA